MTLLGCLCTARYGRISICMTQGTRSLSLSLSRLMVHKSVRRLKGEPFRCPWRLIKEEKKRDQMATPVTYTGYSGLPVISMPYPRACALRIGQPNIQVQ